MLNKLEIGLELLEKTVAEGQQSMKDQLTAVNARMDRLEAKMELLTLHIAGIPSSKG